MQKFWCCAVSVGLCIASSFVLSDELATEDIPTSPTPWFTGPIVAPSAYTIEPKHVNIQPYLLFTAYTATFNEHWRKSSVEHFYTTALQVFLKTGITKWADIQIAPQAFCNETEGVHYVGVGDIPLTLSFQLLDSYIDDPWPAIKLALRVNFPTGKYERLNPSRKFTDANGAGSWLPAVGVVAGKLMRVYGIHYLECRLAINYQIGTSVHVKGLNTYGGSIDTDGFEYPGNVLFIDAALQYNLTQNWALAADFIYQHTNKNRFSGRSGEVEGVRSLIKRPSTEQFSVAPAVEYNFSKNIGLISGVWLSVAGRNSFFFASGVVSLNVYY